MIKAIIFDWGGVLHMIDSKGFRRDLSSRYGVDETLLEKIEIKERLKMDSGEINVDEYLNNINSQLKIKLNEKDYYDLFFSKYVKLNKVLLNLIKKLKKNNYKLFILSNNNPFFYKYMKKTTEFESIFDKIILSFQEKNKKPNISFFLKVLEKTDIEPQEAIFVDDREEYKGIVRKIGMKFLLFRNNKQLKQDFIKLNIKIN